MSVGIRAHGLSLRSKTDFGLLFDFQRVLRLFIGIKKHDVDICQFKPPHVKGFYWQVLINPGKVVRSFVGITAFLADEGILQSKWRNHRIRKGDTPSLCRHSSIDAGGVKLGPKIRR